MIPKNFNFITRVSQQLIKDIANDVIGILEERAPQLSLALDFLRPHVQALGIRVAKLSGDHVEIILPSKSRNLSEKGFVLEGAVVMAACEAYRWLWKQNQPDHTFHVQIGKIQFEEVKSLRGDLRLKAELSELVRETALLELSKYSKSDSNAVIMVFAADEQLVAKVEIEARLALTPSLEWT